MASEEAGAACDKNRAHAFSNLHHGMMLLAGDRSSQVGCFSVPGMEFQTEDKMKILPVLPRAYGDDCSGCTSPGGVDVLRFQRAIRAITGKWKIEIVCMLIEGPMRFGALKRSLPGVTQHMLTEQLRELASNGIVIRRAYAEVPPRVEYELSQAGIDLVPVFRAMLEWSLRYDALLDCDQPEEHPGSADS
jgi:DNA-binding HxlR family transcriptional regulator